MEAQGHFACKQYPLLLRVLPYKVSKNTLDLCCFKCVHPKKLFLLVLVPWVPIESKAGVLPVAGVTSTVSCRSIAVTQIFTV